MLGKKELSDEVIKELDRLIEQVIKAYNQYNSYMNEVLTELDKPSYAQLLIGNKFSYYPKSNNSGSSKDKNKVLKDGFLHLQGFFNSVNTLDNYFEGLKYERKALISSLNDLEHFYKIINRKNNSNRKINKFKKAIVPISLQDEAPLLNLKGSKDHIDVFTKNDSIYFDQIEDLLKKNDNGKYYLDENGYYVIDKEYFITRFYKTIGNIKKNIHNQKKKFAKINQAHKNETQLTNYLKFY